MKRLLIPSKTALLHFKTNAIRVTMFWVSVYIWKSVQDMKEIDVRQQTQMFYKYG